MLGDYGAGEALALLWQLSTPIITLWQRLAVCFDLPLQPAFISHLGPAYARRVALSIIAAKKAKSMPAVAVTAIASRGKESPSLIWAAVRASSRGVESAGTLNSNGEE
ncbi:hypothetical protein AC579_4209 [Pseudocercospora musae]|uniref:Uncharacterized protein n=1 Tax=Pseudocercospora musae TaxID=113226 RepID=A0A139IGR4_9PEZI|nr:hypothetical protein AC579_4209 [Pseudocercospora musae]